MKVLIDANVVERDERPYSERSRFQFGTRPYPSRFPYCSA